MGGKRCSCRLQEPLQGRVDGRGQGTLAASSTEAVVFVLVPALPEALANLEQVRVCSRADQVQVVAVEFVEQEPIRFDVAVPMMFPVAAKRVILDPCIAMARDRPGQVAGSAHARFARSFPPRSASFTSRLN